MKAGAIIFLIAAAVALATIISTKRIGDGDTSILGDVISTPILSMLRDSAWRRYTFGELGLVLLGARMAYIASKLKWTRIIVNVAIRKQERVDRDHILALCHE